MSDETVDGVYYPPDGIYFRLYNKSWGYCIYARDHQRPHTGTVLRSTPDYSDQYFTLVRQGKYWSLKNKRTGKFLEAFIDCNDWAYHNAQQTNKTALKLIKSSKNGWDGSFEVVFHTQNVNSTLEGWLRCNDQGFWTPKWSGPHTEDGDQQFWSMLFEDMEFDSIYWDTDKKETVNVKYMVAYSESHTNKFPDKSTTVLIYKDKVAHTSEFTWGFGFPAQFGTSASVKFPEIFEDSTKVTYGSNLDFKWGKKEETSKEWVKSDTFILPEWAKTKLSVLITKGDMTIPFCVTYKSRETGQTAKSWGTWKGTLSWDIDIVSEVVERYRSTEPVS